MTEVILTPLLRRIRRIAGILIYRHRKDETLSWPRWLAGYTNMVYLPTDGHPSKY